MDEMKIKLHTQFMRDMIASIVSKFIAKKIGLKPEIEIDKLEVELVDGKIHFHIDAKGNVDDKALIKINRIIESD